MEDIKGHSNSKTPQAAIPSNMIIRRIMLIFSEITTERERFHSI